MRTAFTALAWGFALAVVAAGPSEQYPFNNQLPPVARYGQAYTYTFLADTFVSSSGSGIAYASTDLPSWLNLDGDSRVLSGTPPAELASSGDQLITFTVTATDNTGSTSVPWNLQVSTLQPPTSSAGALTAALSSSGNISSDTDFVLQPNHPFEITFPADFFSSDGRAVVGHYSVLSDHAPLPIWLNFDGAANKWTGTAPVVNSQIAQAEKYDILFIDSTYNGFASASAQFSLVLGANVLSIDMSTDKVNATVGEPVVYEIPWANISLNGAEIKQANLSNVDVNIPSSASDWLKFDKTNATMLGTPPQDAANTTVTVNYVITDSYQDSVQFNVELDITDKLDTSVFSTSSLPDANATEGSFFTYSIGEYVLNKNAKLDVTTGVDWLQWHADNFTLNGQVPDDFNVTTVSISAALASTKRSMPDNVETDVWEVLEDVVDHQITGLNRATQATAHFSIYGVKKSTTTTKRTTSTRNTSTRTSSVRTTTTSKRTTSGTTSATTTSNSASSQTASRTTNSASGTATGTSSASALAGTNKKSSNSALAIGVGVGVGVGVAALAALALLFFCCRRRRQKARLAAGGVIADGGDPRSPGGAGGKSPGGGQISEPRPTSKGLVMAPVFRTDSTEDEFTSAEEDTIYGGNEEKKVEAWDSPQRASAMNFLSMDGNGDSSTEQIDQNTLNNMTPASNMEGNGGTFPAAAMPPPLAHVDDDDFSGVPRESWKHTNLDDRRWQDARISYSSVASILPTEPTTVQLASSQSQSQIAGARVPPSASVASELAAPAPVAMTRDASSGIIQRVGSHSSSMYSQQPVGGAVAGARDTMRDSSFPRFQSETQFRTKSRQSATSEHFRTASSGEDNSLSDAGDNIRPYQDESGELVWQRTGEAGNRVQTGTVFRKPSKIDHSHEGNEHSGELAFV